MTDRELLKLTMEALQAFMALDRTFSTICDEHLEEAAVESLLGRAVWLGRRAILAAGEQGV